MTTFKRWLAGETKVLQSTLRNLLQAFPDMGQELGLTYDYGPLKDIPILGECYGPEVQPLASNQKRRYHIGAKL